jgi:ABC-type nitrate/sulfonate/bicarbonate transport system permease component
MSADTDITGPDGPAAAAPVQGDSRLVPSGRGRWLSLWGPPFVVLLAFLGLWYVISYLLLSPERRFLLPPPHAVLQVGFLDPFNLRELLQALWLSARVAMVGLSIAIVIGVTLAIAMSQSRWIERSLYPYAVVLQTIPILALVPLFGFWFGFGLTSRVLVCVLIALFPIIADTLFGLRSVEQDHHDLFTLQGAGRLTRLWKLQFPAAMPAIFTGATRLRRPVGDRSDRRRLLLPAGRAGDRHPHRPLPVQVAVRADGRGDPAVVVAWDPGVLVLRVPCPAGGRRLARVRRPRSLNGKAAQAGFATSEPCLYEHEINAWKKPVKYALVNDTGYPFYPQELSIRTGDKAALALCLKKLVPIVQRAQVDFLKSRTRPTSSSSTS